MGNACFWNRRRRAVHSVLLSLTVHAGVGVGVLGAGSAPGRAVDATGVEWSIELEPAPLEPAPLEPAMPATPAPLEVTAPGPALFAAAPHATHTAARHDERARVASRVLAAATPAVALGAPEGPSIGNAASPAPSAVAATPAPDTSPLGAPAARARPGLATRTSAEPLAASEVSQRPRLLAQPTLRYPPRALRLGIQADVMLSLIVEATGAVSGARVLRAAGNGFDEAALEAARRLRFAPGRAEGRAVAVRVTWTCRFRASG